MNKEISRELNQQLSSLLTDTYTKSFSSNQDLLNLSEEISFKLSGFFLRQGINSKITNVRDFIFNTGNEKHVGYFLWSDDMDLEGTEESRFFILLTGFGYVSGAEIMAEDEMKYKLWPTLFSELTPQDVAKELKDVCDKTQFVSENLLVQQYIKILEELSLA